MKLFQELLRGKDIYRICQNTLCENYTLNGLTVDVGSGETLASYHRFFQKNQVQVECLDLSKPKNGQQINLESDSLPYLTGSVDTVLAMNVLEHIFKYEWLVSELYRITKAEGQVFAAVPFLVAYHPDPHDYWRFTEETLGLVFKKAGFREVEIKPFGRGVAVAAYSQLEIILPRIVKMLLLPLVLGFDALISKLFKRSQVKHYPLGYFVVAKK